MATKEKMLAAKALIDSKKYDEAKAILGTVNHPTAQKWISQIDAISQKQRETKKAYSAKKNLKNTYFYKSGLFLFIICAVITLAISFVLEYALNPQVIGVMWPQDVPLIAFVFAPIGILTLSIARVVYRMRKEKQLNTVTFYGDLPDTYIVLFYSLPPILPTYFCMLLLSHRI